MTCIRTDHFASLLFAALVAIAMPADAWSNPMGGGMPAPPSVRPSLPPPVVRPPITSIRPSNDGVDQSRRGTGGGSGSNASNGKATGGGNPSTQGQIHPAVMAQQKTVDALYAKLQAATQAGSPTKGDWDKLFEQWKNAREKLADMNQGALGNYHDDTAFGQYWVNQFGGLAGFGNPGP